MIGVWLLYKPKLIIDINYDGDMKFVINRQPYCLKMRIYKDIWCALICGDISNVYKDVIERLERWGIKRQKEKIWIRLK